MGEVALTLLPLLLPPPVYKEGRKFVRASLEESKRAFIDVKPVSSVCTELKCKFIVLLESLIPLYNQVTIIVCAMSLQYGRAYTSCVAMEYFGVYT